MFFTSTLARHRSARSRPPGNAISVRVAAWLLAIGVVILHLAASATHAQARFTPPADARLINARDFGAAGDGVADDTAALRRALAAARPSGAAALTVYLPDGIYLVTDTVAYPTSRIVLQGQSQANTIIRLAPSTPAFGNPAAPRRVLSQRENPGFSANQFKVSTYDLTVEVGPGNPGAVGLRVHQNNTGGVRNVTVRSTDPNRVGHIGIDLNGSDKGPGMMRNITVEGFDTGIAQAGTEYGMTFDGLTLRNQRVLGFDILWNLVSIRSFRSENTVPALRNSRGYPRTLV